MSMRWKAASGRVVGLRSNPMMSAPRSLSSLAVAAPMPEATPVIAIVLPFMSPGPDQNLKPART